MQRYNVWLDTPIAVDDGRFVLYADHLAEITKKDEEITALEKRISDAGILKLAAENAILQAEVNKYKMDFMLNNPLADQSKEFLYEMLLIEQGEVKALQAKYTALDEAWRVAVEQYEARIKELEGALKRIDILSSLHVDFVQAKRLAEVNDIAKAAIKEENKP